MSNTVEQEIDDDDNLSAEPSPTGSSKNIKGKMKVCNHFVYEFRSLYAS